MGKKSKTGRKEPCLSRIICQKKKRLLQISHVIGTDVPTSETNRYRGTVSVPVPFHQPFLLQGCASGCQFAIASDTHSPRVFPFANTTSHHPHAGAEHLPRSWPWIAGNFQLFSHSAIPRYNCSGEGLCSWFTVSSPAVPRRRPRGGSRGVGVAGERDEGRGGRPATLAHAAAQKVKRKKRREVEEEANGGLQGRARLLQAVIVCLLAQWASTNVAWASR